MKISFEARIHVDKKSGRRYVKSSELTRNDVINLAKRVKEEEKKKNLVTKLSKLNIK